MVEEKAKPSDTVTPAKDEAAGRRPAKTAEAAPAPEAQAESAAPAPEAPVAEAAPAPKPQIVLLPKPRPYIAYVHRLQRLRLSRRLTAFKSTCMPGLMPGFTFLKTWIAGFAATS